MKNLFFIVASVSLAFSVSSSAKESYSILSSPLDFSAPTVAARQNLSQAGAGTIVFDTSSNAFFGLPPSADPTTAGNWIQLGSAVGSGTVTSSGTGYKIEAASITTTCTSGACTITGTPAISITHGGSTGFYTVNFATGTFSVIPSCTANVSNGSDNYMVFSNSASTANSVVVIMTTPSASGVDGTFNITCMGN